MTLTIVEEIVLLTVALILVKLVIVLASDVILTAQGSATPVAAGRTTLSTKLQRSVTAVHLAACFVM